MRKNINRKLKMEQKKFMRSKILNSLNVLKSKKGAKFLIIQES